MNAIREPIQGFARKKLRDCVEDLTKVPGKSVETASGIRALRVVLRRAENCVGLFGAMFSKSGTEKVLAEIGDIRKQLGAVRDCDIVIQAATQVSGAVNPTLLNTLLDRRTRRLRKISWKPNRNASRWKDLLKV